jgi:hypothetical protein
MLGLLKRNHRWAWVPLLRTFGMTSGALAMIALMPLAMSAQTEEPENAPTSEPEETSTETAQAPRFVCELYEGEYTVLYRPESQPGQVYPWAKPGQLGGGWTPERRCAAISARLEQYRPEGLVELRTDIENGYNTVCATTEQSPGACSIVFTVPPGQDPIATRDAVFDNLTLADEGVSTDAVNTFAGGADSNLLGQLGQVLNRWPETGGGWRPSRSGLALKPYLDPADGGTGEYLNSVGTGRRLDPDRFR